MRQRLGALHADSLEEYIELAKMSWQQNLIFYGSDQEIAGQQRGFDNSEKETNTTSIDEETEVKDRSNVNVLVIDNLDKIDQVFKYCGTIRKSKKNYYLEYCSKQETSSSKEIHFHFWVINQTSVKYQELIEVYYRTADCYVYLNKQSKDHQFQRFFEKVKLLNKHKTRKIYRIGNFRRVSSQQNLQNIQDNQIITLRNLKEGLKKIREQYF
ncbi:unnamed protein product (macronuclear) [Paramecium tetraurelia]|uniref:Uncharacterized protein n=1 Tax=Paramecium tetraurelia TaxID=5888 RepID=A0BTU0_PARTE|nr:uncharacterized protein GSPATT00032189001 [Paramecium tetraurelia]CAK61957.1 unnamed protein product [Paramecium tetraurelia]|eukprot:XP_001429355.1 hypothetical protein (macronuclear) [Paramecium tetraurelia strain d4-2]